MAGFTSAHRSTGRSRAFLRHRSGRSNFTARRPIDGVGMIVAMNIEPDIREELPRDLSAISEVHRAAFGRDAEGMLVDRLRLEGLVVASVVAVVEGRVAGNAVFSEIVIRTAGGRNEKVVALAPVAVMPEFQRRGLGSRVIDAGLKVCAKRDCTAAF